MKTNEWFRKFAHVVSDMAGSPGSFLLSLVMVLVWLATGPYFHYSDTWQLVINTGTTIITFLMVFLIQSSQNRDSRALHLKLNELLYALHGARNSMVNLDELSDQELDRLDEEFRHISEKVTARKKQRGTKRPPKSE